MCRQNGLAREMRCIQFEASMRSCLLSSSRGTLKSYNDGSVRRCFKLYQERYFGRTHFSLSLHPEMDSVSSVHY